MRANGISGNIDGIQIMRFFAAALVLLQHSHYISAVPRNEVSKIFLSFEFGYAGVFLFFVISGFVIVNLVGMNPVQFILHRILRIYPPLFMALAISAVIGVLSGSYDFHGMAFNESMLLIPDSSQFINWWNVPYWTLVYEVVFYSIIFLLMIVGKYAVDIALVLRCFVILLMLAIGIQPQIFTTNLIGMVTSPICLPFIVGAALARWHNNSSTPLVLVMTLILLDAIFIGSLAFNRIILVSCAGVFAIEISIKFKETINNSALLKPMVVAGNWSYGLYLLHAAFVHAIGYSTVGTLDVGQSAALCFLFGGAGGLLFGWFETYLYRKKLRPLADKIAMLLSPSLKSQAIEAINLQPLA